MTETFDHKDLGNNFLR